MMIFHSSHVGGQMKNTHIDVIRSLYDEELLEKYRFSGCRHCGYDCWEKVEEDGEIVTRCQHCGELYGR